MWNIFSAVIQTTWSAWYDVNVYSFLWRNWWLGCLTIMHMKISLLKRSTLTIIYECSQRRDSKFNILEMNWFIYYAVTSFSKHGSSIPTWIVSFNLYC